MQEGEEAATMLQEKGNRFWRACLLLCVMVAMIVSGTVGCSDKPPVVSYTDITVPDRTAASMEEGNNTDAERITAVYHDIYDEAVRSDTLDSLATKQRIIARLGENGYVTVDSENQIDMAGAEQVMDFCGAVDDRENDRLTIIVIVDLGFQKYDFETEDGDVKVVREYYQYDRSGCPQNRDTVSYPADLWQYTEEGYLIFEGSYFSDENYVLTLSDAQEHAALRVLPLDERCRELNRKYIRLVGYEQNNIFLTDWNEKDFGDLDFYDIFDRFYPFVYGKSLPYVADFDAGAETVYQIPEDVFEKVVMAHFHIAREALRQETTYLSEDAAYMYRPRGFYEAEYSDIPYPEVVSYTENEDGTITLIVNAVYPNENTSKSYTHKTVIRPLDENSFQYVSNQMLSPAEDYDTWWHSDRLTEEAQEPQCLFTEAEQEELENAAMTAAKQAADVYKDIELAGESSFGSNIREFTAEQRKEVVALLGSAGYVSVTEDTNMENYEKVEEFYAAYEEKRDAEMTIFHVSQDGLIRAITFLYRDNALQTCYVGIGWQEGGTPEIKSTIISDVAEMKLTDKGYLIYAYKDSIPHSDLCQYWRIKPLSDQCRELTAKYVYGLSYVNYNVLVTNWDGTNVEDILMPCMFEDIYRIYTGENLKAENWRIPADTYEKIMTTYFPVSVEQLRKTCGYDEDSGSYEYEMISARPYPPFGEVVDYRQNEDGTITLYVDGVWPDYNSDCAFTNTIVVQPFADGTFRYLSNTIEQKELEIPEVLR